MEFFSFFDNTIIGILAALSLPSVNNLPSIRVKYYGSKVPDHVSLVDLPGNQEIIARLTAS